MPLLSDASLRIGGVLLLSIVAVAYGGTFLLRVARGAVPATELQVRFFRAGHAHAGVLLILALATQPFADAADLQGAWGFVARSGVAAAAVFIPAGFFLSVIGRDVERPNRLIGLLWVGVVVLTLGVVTLGIGVLRAS